DTDRCPGSSARYRCRRIPAWDPRHINQRRRARLESHLAFRMPQRWSIYPCASARGRTARGASSGVMKAFISSTSEDLADYRAAAREVCARLSLIPVGMEDFESMGVGATAGSQSKVKESNVYVGIIANRYGYIEAGHDKSVTELEFEYAGRLGLDRLCF